MSKCSHGRVFEFLAEEEMEDESRKEDGEMKGQMIFDQSPLVYTRRTIGRGFSRPLVRSKLPLSDEQSWKTTIVNLLMKFAKIDKVSH